MNKVVTKVAMLFFAVALAVGMTSCDNSSNVQSTQVDKQETSQPVQKPAYNPISQWDFTDYVGQNTLLYSTEMMALLN